MAGNKKKLVFPKVQKEVRKWLVIFWGLLLGLGVSPVPVYAANSGQQTLYKAIGFLCGWAAKIGLFVAFYGALKLVLAFAQENPDAKIQGIITMVTGLIIMSIARSANLFI